MKDSSLFRKCCPEGIGFDAATAVFPSIFNEEILAGDV
jgi:hypothetical protein